LPALYSLYTFAIFLSALEGSFAMNDTPEIWKPIIGYEGFYEISNKGRVASIKNGERFVRKANKATHYLTVSLKKRPCDLYQKSPTIHSLVASAFLGIRPNGYIIRHIDGNRYNNFVTNLCYGTKEDNYNDSVKHGTHAGGNNGRAVLNETSVKAIKMLLALGVGVNDISNQLGVTKPTLYAIKNNRNWKGVS
jgi:hypothetical protein